MLKSETSLWKWLSCLRGDLSRADLHMSRVENSAAPGMPDVEGCFRHKQFWLELKIGKRRAGTSAVDVDHLRVKQVQWLHNRWLVGGNAWLLIRVESEAASRDPALYLLPGNLARDVLEGMTELEMRRASHISPDASQEEILWASVDREKPPKSLR